MQAKNGPTWQCKRPADLSHVLKNISDINELRFVDSEVHLDGIITGRGWWEIQQDYVENVFGECSITAVDPFMVLPDCDGQDYDQAGPEIGASHKLWNHGVPRPPRTRLRPVPLADELPHVQDEVRERRGVGPGAILDAHLDQRLRLRLRPRALTCRGPREVVAHCVDAALHPSA